jgi:DNA-binding NarL/FixJ family response regulator
MGPALRVLIAGSDASVRDAFVDVLRRADIDVIAVADAAATLELAQQRRPHVVLVDDELPGIGGVAALPRLAAEIPDSELVVLAARFDRGSGVRAVLAGAAGYITRGVAAEALPRIVRGVMRGEAAIPAHPRHGRDRAAPRARPERGWDAPDREPAQFRRTRFARPDGHRRLPAGNRYRAGGPARDGPQPRAAHFGQTRNPLAGSGDRNRPAAPPPAPRLSRPVSGPARPGGRAAARRPRGGATSSGVASRPPPHLGHRANPSFSRSLRRPAVGPYTPPACTAPRGVGARRPLVAAESAGCVEERASLAQLVLSRRWHEPGPPRLSARHSREVTNVGAFRGGPNGDRSRV